MIATGRSVDTERKHRERGEGMLKRNNITHRYDDIIGLAHHVSATRPRMAMSDRAAQFSPFAALTGHDAAIRETGRLTHARIELDESQKTVLDEKLRLVFECIEERPEITVVFFQPDDRKSGGAYVSITGYVKKLDTHQQSLMMDDKTVIPLDQIYEIDGELFDQRF